jgi:hypothetical protein
VPQDHGPEYNVMGVELPMWGRVVKSNGVVPFEVLDCTGEPIEPIRRYLHDFHAQGRRPGGVRSYAYDLLRWWRWLLCTMSSGTSSRSGLVPSCQWLRSCPAEWWITFRFGWC